MPYYRRKKYVPKRKRMAMRKRRSMRKSSDGVINLSRKCPEQNVYNTATTAVAASSGSVVVIGTPYQTPAFAGSTYYNVPFSVDLTLNDVLSASELTTIADRYKINWAKIRIFCTSNTASAGGLTQLPSILWSTDADDAVVPASSTVGLNSIREKMGSKIRQFKQNGGPLSIFMRPKIAMGAWGGAAVVAPVVSPAKFIDCNAPDVPHYALRGYLQDVNLASTASVYTQFKFDITLGITLRGIQ